MVKEDIAAGLRNAVERGYSLQEAKQSFINAGYKRPDVEEAAHFISSGILTTINKDQERKGEKAERLMIPIGKPVPEFQSKKKKDIFLIIFLLLVLIILLGVLGFAFYFKEELTAFIEQLLS